MDEGRESERCNLKNKSSLIGEIGNTENSPLQHMNNNNNKNNNRLTITTSIDNQPAKMNHHERRTMMVQTDDTVSLCEDNKHCKSWILTICLWILIALKIVCEIFKSSFCDYDGTFYQCKSPCDFCIHASPAWWICFGSGLVLYFVEFYFCSTRKYLKNVVPDPVILTDILTKLQKGEPKIWMKVSNYHMETRERTVHYTDSNGESQTRSETYDETVVTSQYDTNYDFKRWKDVSTNFNDLNEYSLTKLKVSKAFRFSNDETKANWAYLSNNFQNDHKFDKYQKFTYGMEIDGYKPQYFCELKHGMKPGWINSTLLYIFTFALLSPIYRTCVSYTVGTKKYTIIKEISI